STFMVGRYGDVISLGERCDLPDLRYAAAMKIGTKHIYHAFSQQVLKKARMGDLASKADGSDTLFGNLANCPQIRSCARFVDPKRMKPLDRGGHARRIPWSKPPCGFQDEVDVCS